MCICLFTNRQILHLSHTHTHTHRHPHGNPFFASFSFSGFRIGLIHDIVFFLQSIRYKSFRLLENILYYKSVIEHTVAVDTVAVI